MNTRLLLAFALLATLAASARASFYFTWNAPSSVNVGQNYTVGVQAYFTPDYSGDPYAVLGLYRNGSQIGGGSTGAYGSATASNSFTDNAAQTVGYSADMYSYYGETGYSSHSLTVTGAPANNPPTAWVTVDGQSHGATVTRPYGGSVNVTVRYKASDPDNNLARIRPQVWHPSGYLNNNGGNFIGQSGGYGEVAWTVTLNENGNWHFWTDAEDTNNVFVNSGAWSSGFRLTVVEGAPPNTPPTVTLHSPAGQTIYLNQALTITSQAGVGKVLDLAGIVPLSNNQVVVKLKLDNDQYFITPRYSGYFASLGASAKISYHNADDFWLVTGSAFAGLLETNWIANNAKYKPDGARTAGNYRFDFLEGPFFEMNSATQRGIIDAHEVMAFVCRSMTLALGAVAPSPVFSSQVNLKAQYGFGIGRPDHSGQFQRDIQYMYGNENGVAWSESFYSRLMRDLQVTP